MSLFFCFAAMSLLVFVSSGHFWLSVGRKWVGGVEAKRVREEQEGDNEKFS
jgi:hypothetical protein